MRVILLKNTKGVGKRNEVKEVPDGYARNFLIPRKVAVIATDSEVAKLDSLKQAEKARSKKNIEELKHLAKKLENEKLQFVLKTGRKGEVFGSVTRKEIEEKLSKEGIKEARVLLEYPIKSIGISEVVADLGYGVKVLVKIAIQVEKQ